MKMMKLTYGTESFNEIQEFLNNNYYEGYTLSIYNNIERSTAEIICSFDQILNVITYISNIEHNFPVWISVNELTDSYVVGLDFIKGHIHTPSII